MDGEALGDAAVSVAVGRGVSEEAPPALPAPPEHPASERARTATAPRVVTVVIEREVSMCVSPGPSSPRGRCSESRLPRQDAGASTRHPAAGVRIGRQSSRSVHDTDVRPLPLRRAGGSRPVPVVVPVAALALLALALSGCTSTTRASSPDAPAASSSGAARRRRGVERRRPRRRRPCGRRPRRRRRPRRHGVRARGLRPRPRRRERRLPRRRRGRRRARGRRRGEREHARRVAVRRRASPRDAATPGGSGAAAGEQLRRGDRRLQRAGAAGLLLARRTGVSPSRPTWPTAAGTR